MYMKKLYHLMIAALAAVALFSDCQKYDDSELKNEIQELGERSRGVMDAAKELLGA